MSIIGRKFKSIHIHAGLDLIGSKTSVHHKESEIIMHENGVELKSKKTGREFFIPFANIKGGELLPVEMPPAEVKRGPGRPAKTE